VRARTWKVEERGAGHATPTTPPESLDFDFWTGPAAAFPYIANRVHNNWRWFFNTGTGKTGDWGVHMMDIALLGMSKDQDLVMPTKVTSFGGQFAFTDDDRNAPDTMEAIYEFDDPKFVMHWAINRDHPGMEGHGTEFVSADGRTLRVWRGGWKILDPGGKELPKEESENPPNHWRDFVDSVKSRSKPRADLGSVAQTTVVCHLSNVALQAGEMVRWDAKKQDIAGKAGRNSLSYHRPYRKGYELPKYSPSG